MISANPFAIKRRQLALAHLHVRHLPGEIPVRIGENDSRISTRVPYEVRRDAEHRAAQLGWSLSDYTRTAIERMNALDPPARKRGPRRERPGGRLER